MRFDINWHIVLSTIAVILTIVGSAVGVTLAISTQFAEIREDIAGLKKGQEELKRRQDGVERLLGDLWRRQDGVERRLDGLERLLGDLWRRQDGVERRLDDLWKRFDDLYPLLLNRSKAPGQPAAEAGQPMAAAGQATTAAAGQADEANQAPAGQVAPAKSAPQSD